MRKRRLAALVPGPLEQSSFVSVEYHTHLEYTEDGWMEDARAREIAVPLADIERAVYDAELAARMKKAREARALRASSWTELRRALRPSLEAAQAKAQALLGDALPSIESAMTSSMARSWRRGPPRLDAPSNAWPDAA